VERAPQEEPFDEIVAMHQRELREEAIRLLGALGEEPEFPRDVAGVEALIQRVAIDPMGVTRFRVEPPGALPRFTAEYLTWISPTGDGALRLRKETYALEAFAATVGPDGTLRDFAHETGFGVPDSELTPQARADRGRVERRRREAEAEAAESRRRLDGEQRRFRTEHLRGVVAAPWQDPAGPVVAWVAFYDDSFIVAFFAPGEVDLDQVSLDVHDDLGNSYEVVGLGPSVRHRPLHKDLLEFGPAVADGASRLIFRSDSGSVDVEVVR
jgi:hypothetical protein